MQSHNLRIAAFGDSLTDPAYTNELERIVRDEGRFPNATVEGYYHPGTITCDLKILFEEDVLQKKPQAVVLLGGTNNLGHAVEQFLDTDTVITALHKKYPNPTEEQLISFGNMGMHKIKSEIVDSLNPNIPAKFFEDCIQHTFEDLASMYQKAREYGIFPIAVAVPPANVSGYSRALIVPPRIALNDLIMEYCTEHGIPYADLFTATAIQKTSSMAKRFLEKAHLSGSQKTGLMLPQYSRDGLHFNDDGYKLMARVVFEQGVKPFLAGYKPL